MGDSLDEEHGLENYVDLSGLDEITLKNLQDLQDYLINNLTDADQLNKTLQSILTSTTLGSLDFSNYVSIFFHELP